MIKKRIKLTESELRRIVNEVLVESMNNGLLSEAYNELQYANLAGQANGALNTVGGKLRGMFDRKWKNRKERQQKKFGLAAQGYADENNFMKNDDINNYSSEIADGHHMYDRYANKYDGKDNETPFKMKRQQFTGGSYINGAQHGETMNGTTNDFRRQASNRLVNREINHDYGYDSDAYDQDISFSRTNDNLNKQFKNGRDNAMGKVKKGSRTMGGVSNYGTGTQNGQFKAAGKGNH